MSGRLGRSARGAAMIVIRPFTAGSESGGYRAELIDGAPNPNGRRAGNDPCVRATSDRRHLRHRFPGFLTKTAGRSIPIKWEAAPADTVGWAADGVRTMWGT